MVGARGSAQHEMMLSRAVNLYESLFDNNKGVTQTLWLFLQLPAYMLIALAGRSGVCGVVGVGTLGLPAA